MKILQLLLALLLQCHVSAEIYYYDVVQGVDAGLALYYDDIATPAALPTYSAGTAPLQDISNATTTVTGLNSISNNFTSGIDNVKTGVSQVALLGDNALASMYHLPSASGTLTSYSLGNFVLGGRSFAFNINFAPYASSIALVRTCILIVMTVCFCLTIASTIRGYL